MYLTAGNNILQVKMKEKIMNKSILLVSALLTLTSIPFVEAQTTSPGVNQILEETGTFINEIEPEIQELEAEVEEYQSYLNGLYQNCMNGSNSACKEYKRRQGIVNTGLDGARIQTSPNSPKNSGWSDSFCHPYCN